MATQSGMVLLLTGDTVKLDFPFSDAEDHDAFQLANGKYIVLAGTDEQGNKRYKEITAAQAALLPNVFVDASIVVEASIDHTSDPDQ